MTALTVKNYALPAVDEKEVLRYAACREANEQVLALLRECVKEAEEKLSCKACYAVFPVNVGNGVCDFGSFSLRSTALSNRLKGCKKAAIFCATIGLEMDRFIAKYGKISPSKGLLMQALGTERVEAFCSVVCKEIERVAGASTTLRFSPGYADLPLEAQTEIFRVLEISKGIGVYLSDSLLMSPSKSVTAIVGICEQKNEGREKCRACEKTDCTYRRE